MADYTQEYFQYIPQRSVKEQFFVLVSGIIIFKAL